MGPLVVGIICFLVLFPVFLIFSEMWSQMRPIVYNQTLKGTNSNYTNANAINRLGDSFFYYSGDTVIVLMYFILIVGVMISALYENAHPETLPIGLLVLIPLIIITIVLADLSHWFYSNSGFANIIAHYPSTIYLSDYAPYLTALFSIAYLVLVISKKHVFNIRGGGPSSNVVSG